jgi:hypothetical protein
MSFRINIDCDLGDILRRMTRNEQAAKDALKQAVDDCADDLIRVSSEITPIDKGILQRSHSKEIKVRGVEVEAEISYAIRERNRNGDFNYALWIHEGTYNLGAASRARPGTQGMSGQTYTVGNKYLERPLEGEKQTYLRYISDEVARAVGGD